MSVLVKVNVDVSAVAKPMGAAVVTGRRVVFVEPKLPMVSMPSISVAVTVNVPPVIFAPPMAKVTAPLVWDPPLSVDIVILPAPTLIAAPMVISEGFSAEPVGVAPESSASKVRFASFRVILAFTAMSSPACKVRFVPSPEFPVAVAISKADETVISSLACRIILKPLAMPLKLPLACTSKVLSTPESSPKFSVRSDAASKPAVLTSAVVRVILLGSSRSVPGFPFTEDRLINEASKMRCCLPETSANPPSPPSAPPRALISP